MCDLLLVINSNRACISQFQRCICHLCKDGNSQFFPVPLSLVPSVGVLSGSKQVTSQKSGAAAAVQCEDAARFPP